MKTSIRLIGLCFVLVTFSGFAFAQKCKYSYEKTDVFSGEPSKGTTKLAFGLLSELTMDRTGNKYTMLYAIRFDNFRDDYVEKGDSLSFKLQNGNIVTFYTNNRYEPEYNVSVNGTIYRPQYEMPVDKLRLLAESPATYMRMNAGALVFQKEMSGKNGEKLQKDANCLLQ